MRKLSFRFFVGVSLLSSMAFAGSVLASQGPDGQNGMMSPPMQGAPTMQKIKFWHKKISLMKPILVKASNPEVTVRLPANPTTGFNWFLSKYNPDFVKPVGSKYIAPVKQIAGASGYMEWKFKIDEDAFVVPQVIKVVFVYARPWTHQGKTMKIVTFITQPK